MKSIFLREWELKDAPAIAKAADNSKIADNLRNAFPHPYTLEDAEWFIRDCIAHKEDDRLMYAIIADEMPVGSISVVRMEDVYERSAELGYWLAEDYWRQGIMLQAVRMICREAFDSFDINRIFAEPFAQNAASRGLLEKAGFFCEGTMRDGIYKNGRTDSYCIYSLLRKEKERLDGN